MTPDEVRGCTLEWLLARLDRLGARATLTNDRLPCWEVRLTGAADGFGDGDTPAEALRKAVESDADLLRRVYEVE